MRSKNLCCPGCGEHFPADPKHPPVYCPHCAVKLPEDLKPEEERHFLPQQEAIPDLPTEGAQEKTKGQYALEALRWAAVVVGLILVLGFLYSQAAQLLH